MTDKWCSKCQVTKAITRFPAKKGYPNEVLQVCNKCRGFEGVKNFSTLWLSKPIAF